MLIQLNIKLHSGKIIPVAFHSGAFRGTFRYQFRNAWIPPERVTTGMAILAEPPANFHSSRMHRIPPESPESGRNLWGTDKTSTKYQLYPMSGCPNAASVISGPLALCDSKKYVLEICSLSLEIFTS